MPLNTYSCSILQKGIAPFIKSVLKFLWNKATAKRSRIFHRAINFCFSITTTSAVPGASGEALTEATLSADFWQKRVTVLLHQNPTAIYSYRTFCADLMAC